MKVSPSPSLLIAVVAVKPQLNLYFNCTYESDETSPICCEKTLIPWCRSAQVILCSLQRGLGVGIAATLVQYSTLITARDF